MTLLGPKYLISKTAFGATECGWIACLTPNGEWTRVIEYGSYGEALNALRSLAGA